MPNAVYRSVAAGALAPLLKSTLKGESVIARIWHGWTSLLNADAYEQLLREKVFTGIKERHIPGFNGIQMLRRSLETEVEFVTIMRFDSIDAIRVFAGEDYEACVVPPAAHALLSRFDQRSQHYEIRIAEHDAEA